MRKKGPLMQWKFHIGSLVTSARSALTPKGTWPVRWLLPFIPLLFLAIDIAVFPVLIETSDPAKDVTVVRLINRPPYVQYLGNFRAHRIYPSLDNIDDPDYLSFITKGPPDEQKNGNWIWGSPRNSNAALVVQAQFGDGWGSPELTEILDKLDSLSQQESLPSDDHDKIIDLVRVDHPSESVLWHDFKYVSSTSPSTSSLPLDHLVILRFQSQQMPDYSAEIRETLETAGKKHLSTLVLPCLASAPRVESASSLACGHTYEALFQALEPGCPSTIFLSLDRGDADLTDYLIVDGGHGPELCVTGLSGQSDRKRLIGSTLCKVGLYPLPNRCSI